MKKKYYHLQRLNNDQWIFYGHIFESFEDCMKEYNHWLDYDRINKTNQYKLRIVSLDGFDVIESKDNF